MSVWKSLPVVMALAASAIAPAVAANEPASGANARIERMCSTPADASGPADRMQRRADRMVERLNLTDAQKATFKDLADARAKLRADRRAAICANKPDLSSFEARLQFRQTMLENRLADMKTIHPKLVAFYNSLSDYQKGEFDAMWARRSGQRDRG